MIPKVLRRRTATLMLALAIFVANTASAVRLSTAVSPIYQVGNGATVKVGHTAIANTAYNRLFAGGTYSAACASPDMVPANGQRFVSADNVLGGLTLYVTIPSVHPAYINMPGFDSSRNRGMRLNCVYNWTSRAVEGGYTVGAGGISFQTGNGEASEGSSQIFVMDVPGLGDEDEWTPCLP
jgi:hypothetical protein